MTIDEKVDLLIQHIKNHEDFKIVQPEYPYNHMGMTITEAILQAGTNGETVVKGRYEPVVPNFPPAPSQTEEKRAISCFAGTHFPWGVILSTFMLKRCGERKSHAAARSFKSEIYATVAYVLLFLRLKSFRFNDK